MVLFCSLHTFLTFNISVQEIILKKLHMSKPATNLLHKVRRLKTTLSHLKRNINHFNLANLVCLFADFKNVLVISRR